MTVSASLLSRYFLATRPAFLSITLLAVLLGLATAHADGVAIHPLTAWVTLLFALLAHAGANVLNDYFDALNGSDASNDERVFPFTGGSRFIQNGLLTTRQTAIFGATLLALVVPAGCWLVWQSGSALLFIGMAGLLLGWAYSAPPLKLASRGLGELAVFSAWLLIIAGADYVQRGAFGLTPYLWGMSYAMLLANMLFLNQFPDVRADARAGKRTLVVRLGRQRARWGYLLLMLLAHAWLLGGISIGILPQAALLAMLAAPLVLHAAHGLWLHAEQPARLAPAIKLSISAALLHGLLLVAALVFLEN